MASSPATSAAALRLLAIPVVRRAAAAQQAPAAAASASSSSAANAAAAAFVFAWRSDADPSTTALPPISAGATLADCAVLLGAHARRAAERRLEHEWRAVEEAPARSVKGLLRKLANAVQSRADPTEAALARVPRTLDAHSPAVAAAIRRARRPKAEASSSSSQQQQQPNQHPAPSSSSFEILHPASVDPRLVRRLLRRLCAKRAPEHRRGAMLWVAALVPQAPLSVLPLPNITIYYTLWRAFMNWSASVGAASLLAALDRLSDEQRRRVLAAAAARVAAAPSPSAEASSSSSSPTPLPAPVLVARADLPSPLSGRDDAERVAALLGEPHVVERFAALERRMGAAVADRGGRGKGGGGV